MGPVVTILASSDPGCEEACMHEIGEHLRREILLKDGLIQVLGTLEEAVILGYHLQTARRVVIQLADPVERPEDFQKQALDQELLKEIVPEATTFKVEGESFTENLMTQELVEPVAEWLHTTMGWPADLSRPKTVVRVIATGTKIFTGIDVVGKDLGKRDWRIMLSRRSLRATVAAAVGIYAGITPQKVILDPLADDGTLTIEAALFLTKTSPRKHERSFAFEHFPHFEDRDWAGWRQSREDKVEITKITAFSSTLNDMKAVRMNSKMAGVDKDIKSTRVSLDWADTKMEEDSVDLIMTYPTTSGKAVSEKASLKRNDDLFNQSRYLLKREGTMICIADKPEELLPGASDHGFKEIGREDIMMGKRPMTIITFGGE